MIEDGIKKRKLYFYKMTLLMLVGVVILSVLTLTLGQNHYSLQTVLMVLGGEEVKGASFVIKTLRLPRLLAGLLAGMAFGVAGSTFQTLLRNPLASPDVIGVTSATSTAAVFCILVLGWSGLKVSIVSVLFGLFIAGLIYLLSRGNGFSGGRLILIGIGLQAILRAMTNFFLLRAGEHDVPAAMRWLTGSLNTLSLDDLPRLFIMVVVGTLMVIGLRRQLQILELGELSAVTLGVKVEGVRLTLMAWSVIMVAFATALTGPIAFVAFLAGPIAKKMVGASQVHTFPAGLMGMLLILGADLISQNALAIKYPVGVVTGILGAPYLILLLVRMNRQGGY